MATESESLAQHLIENEATFGTGENLTMQDTIILSMIQQELQRKWDIDRAEREDPDQLYRYEPWEGTGAISRIRAGFSALYHRLRHSSPGIAECNESAPAIPTTERMA